MMDLSDGLAKDLPALTPAGTEPAIDETAVPVSAAARTLARRTAQSPLFHAFCDGEDYELVFAVARRADRAAFERAWHQRFSPPALAASGVSSRREKAANTTNLATYHGYEHLC